jgi:tetratricopeptide (TPR) repeat protein
LLRPKDETGKMATTSTTSVEAAKRAATAPPPDDGAAIHSFFEWVKRHRQLATTAAVVVVLGGALGWWNVVSRNRVEASADEGLGQARLAFESHNYPLAASELSQIVENYSGTRAASQANLLLGQVRLYQGQNQQAIDLLKRVAPALGRDYKAQGYGLLGAAYENGRFWKESAGAYEDAAREARYPFLKAQFLSDAARVWLAAGDTTRAVAAYRTIVSGMDSTVTIGEAKVRLGELTRGADSTVRVVSGAP